MSDKRRQRGRPKGSGINDWERLLTIASLMEKNPKLKVTTAIKELGFTDPSVIRRLRDKFKANRRILLRPPKRRDVGEDATPSTHRMDTVAMAAMPLLSHGSADTKRSFAVEELAAAPVNDNETPAVRSPFGTGDFAECMVLGFKSYALVTGIQAEILRSVLGHPATHFAFRQHMTVCEAVSSAFFTAARAREY